MRLNLFPSIFSPMNPTKNVEHRAEEKVFVLVSNNVQRILNSNKVIGDFWIIYAL